MKLPSERALTQPHTIMNEMTILNDDVVLSLKIRWDVGHWSPTEPSGGFIQRNVTGQCFIFIRGSEGHVSCDTCLHSLLTEIRGFTSVIQFQLFILSHLDHF